MNPETMMVYALLIWGCWLAAQCLTPGDDT